MPTTVPTAGYDKAGNMTVYHLAPGETLPPGAMTASEFALMQAAMPPSRRASNAIPPPEPPIETFEQYTERVGTDVDGPPSLTERLFGSDEDITDIVESYAPEPLRRKRGRPPKVRLPQPGDD